MKPLPAALICLSLAGCDGAALEPAPESAFGTGSILALPSTVGLGDESSLGSGGGLPSPGEGGAVVRDDGPAIGTLDGRVVDAVSGAPLAGVAVTLARVDGERTAIPLATGSSGSDGRYRFDGLPPGGRYRVDLARAGYRDESHVDVLFGSGEGAAARTLEPVRLVPDDNAGPGSVAGTVTSAADGSPLGGLRVTFRRGVGARTGDVVARARTADDGSYAVDGLAHGNVTGAVSGDGVATAYFTATVLGGVALADRDVAVFPSAGVDTLRIVLTWGGGPADLDAHLTGPGADGEPPFHLYHGDPDVGVAVLDVDDLVSFGPETIVLGTVRAGVHRYGVYNFSGGDAGALSDSGARVRVFRAGDPVADFPVPRGRGDLWTVFDLVDGDILPVDTLTDLVSDEDHFAPGTLR